MGKCSVQFGNKSNGIFLEYNKRYEEELNVFLNSKTSYVKKADFSLVSRYYEDEELINKIKNLTLQSSKIVYNFSKECIIDIVIDIQGKQIYVMYLDWENEVEQLTEVRYDLKPNDIKKLLKFAKEMQQV